MKQILFTLSILVLVSCKSNTTIQSSTYKTMMIKSVGEVETRPDMASFYINLSCLDKSIEKSKQCLVDKSNELHEQLLSFGIAEKDIFTSSVTMNKSYIWNSGNRLFEGYRSSSQIFITIRAIDNLDAIYTDLLGNESIELAGLNYSHSQMDSLKNEAYMNALEKSGATVDRLLEQLPESKKEVMKIGNVEISTSVPDPLKVSLSANYRADAESDNSVVISKGTIKVNATLYVEYKVR